VASVKKRPNGSWRARYRDEQGKEHARHFPRKKDADDWLNSITVQVGTGTYVNPNAGKVTLQDYYATWAERQIWESGTRRAMDLSVRSCTFADLEMRSIRRSSVESWVKAMTTAGLAPQTIHTRMQNVRSVLRAAVLDRLVASNPTEGVTLPRKRRAEHAMDIPTPETVAALYEASEEWFRPFVALAAFAGLRLGEINGVQLGDIDFLKRKLMVRRQVQRSPGQAIEIRPPKYGSERDIDLADDLLVILSEHVKNVGVYGDANWILPGRDNGPAWPRTLAYYWDKASKSAGIQGVTAHSLRHFYASALIAAGCDVVTVQHALGHSKPSVTLDIYSHLWPTAEDRTRNAAQALIASVLKPPADSSRTQGLSPA
jgi:integrase